MGQEISIDGACDILKEHFPEYLSGHCQCGYPIATYMMWIEHFRELCESSSSPEADETSG